MRFLSSRRLTIRTQWLGRVRVRVGLNSPGVPVATAPEESAAYVLAGPTAMSVVGPVQGRVAWAVVGAAVQAPVVPSRLGSP